MSPSNSANALADWFRWELVRPLIRQMYLEEGKSLQELVSGMASKYNFYASSAQYGRHLKLWRIRKGLPEETWKWVAQEINRLQQQGYNYEVILSGVELPATKVNKAIGTHCYESTLDRLQRSTFSNNTYEIPSDISLSVRRARRQLKHDSSQLLWTSFRNQLYHALAFCASSDRLELSECEELLSIALQNGFWAWQMPLQVTNRAQASQYLTNLLDLYMSESHVGENHARVDYLLTPRTLIEKLEILFFVLCNRLSEYNEKIDETVVEIIKQIRIFPNNSWLRNIVASDHKYCKTLAESIFGCAVKIGDLDLVSWFIAEGMTLDLRINTNFPPLCLLDNCLMFLEGPVFMTPIEIAFRKSDINLARLLNAKGVKLPETVGQHSSARFIVSFPDIFPSKRLELLDLVLDKNEKMLESQLMEALRWAIRFDSYDCARRILEEIWLMRHKSVYGAKLLRLAIIIGHDTIVNTLLQEGADVNGELSGDQILLEKFPRSSVATAIMARRSDIYRLLLRKGASANGLLPTLVPTPLQCAAYMDDVEAIELLCEFHADVNQITGESETSEFRPHRTALQVALTQENERAIHTLLKRGAKMLGGELVTAIASGGTTTCEALLTLGASVNETIKVSGVSALEIAIVRQNNPMIHRLLLSKEYTYCARALHAVVDASWMGTWWQSALVNAIMRNRKLPTSQDLLFEGTALALAVNIGDKLLVSLFLSKGLRPQYCRPHPLRYNKRRWNTQCFFRHYHPFVCPDVPVLTEIVGSDPEIIELLLENGYSVDEDSFYTAAQCSHGPGFKLYLDNFARMKNNRFAWIKRKALQDAISRGNIETATLLLQSGAMLDVAAPEFNQFKFLTIDGPTGLKLVELLLGSGIDVRTANSFILYGLFAAAARNAEVNCIRLLLDAGVDVNANLHPEDGSLLTQAVRWGEMSVVEILLDHGARVDYSSLKMAITCHYFGIAEALIVSCLQGNVSEGLVLPEACMKLALIAENCGYLELQHFLLRVSASIDDCGQTKSTGNTRQLSRAPQSTTKELQKEDELRQTSSSSLPQPGSNMIDGHEASSANDNISQDSTQVVPHNSQFGITEQASCDESVADIQGGVQREETERSSDTEDWFDMFIQIPE